MKKETYEQCKHGGVKAWCPVCKEMSKLNQKKKKAKNDTNKK